MSREAAAGTRRRVAEWLRDAASRGATGKWLWFAIALGALLNAASLRLGLHADDYLQRETVVRHLDGLPDTHAWYELFGSRTRSGEANVREQIALGIHPWWTDPKLSTTLFRPLSALTHYLDYALWRDHFRLMHLHSIAWYVALLLAVARLYRAFELPAFAGALALLFYAFDDAHAETVAWLASRNTIIACVFAVLVLERHHRARVAQRSFGDPWAALLMLCALLASEGAIAVWGYLLCHVIWIDRASLQRRLLALLPLALVTGAWHLTYRAFGFGVHGSGVYLDPFADLIEFAHQLPVRASGLWVEQFGIPIGLCFEFAWLTPYWPYITWTLTVLVLLAIAPRILKDRVERFWFFGCLLSTIPYCVFIPEPRLLLLPSIGGFAVIAAFITRVYSAAVSRWSRALALVLLIIHLPVAAALSVMRSEHQLRSAWWVTALAMTFPYSPDVAGKTQFILNTPTFLATAWSMILRVTLEPKLAGNFVLGASSEPVELIRTSQNDFVLIPHDGYLRELTSRWVRSPRVRFEPGYHVLVGPATVIVEAVTKDGRPARVRVIVRDLDDPRWIWLNMRTTYSRIQLPPVGGSIQL